MWPFACLDGFARQRTERAAIVSMSPNVRPMSANSRAESLDRDLRVIRVSFHVTTAANATAKRLVTRASENVVPVCVFAYAIRLIP